MFEPLTLTLAELAARWNLTTRQVLQHAQQPGVPLYFAFEGLVFDVSDQWHRHGGDWRQTQRRDVLIKNVESGEAWLRRRKEGRLTKWDALSNEEATKLRAEIEASKIELRKLDEVLERRTTERNDRHFRGFLRAAPATLWDIESIGTAPFPHKAFHPSSPVKVVRLPSDQAERGWVWDGRIVSLEPLHENDRHWKKQLTLDDLVAITTEVKAIEAIAKLREASANTRTSAAIDRAHDSVKRQTSNARRSDPRQKPGGGDALTPTIWAICYDLTDAEEKVTPGPVMMELKIRAQSRDPKVRGPLMGTSAGGVKFETVDGEEKELTSSMLAARINEWKRNQS